MILKTTADCVRIWSQNSQPHEKFYSVFSLSMISLKIFSHLSSSKTSYTGNESFWQDSNLKGFPLIWQFRILILVPPNWSPWNYWSIQMVHLLLPQVCLLRIDPFHLHSWLLWICVYQRNFVMRRSIYNFSLVQNVSASIY